MRSRYMYRLVIIEDDYQIRTGLGNFFPWTEIGFQVVGCFENGKQALDYIYSNNVDIILSDIIMPVMTGLELAEELHKKNSKIFIVFLSAYKDFDYAQQALNFGAKNYIVKSTKYDDLISVFRKIKNELDEKNTQKTEEILPEQSSNVNSDHSDNKKIKKIKDYIEKNYRNVTLQNTADEMSMNHVYLSRFFKEKTGGHFIDYVTEVRMKKAAELIKQNNFKLYQISEMVGYSNAKNFSRAFKNYFKVSPQEYRNN